MNEEDILENDKFDGATKHALLQAFWARETENRKLLLEEARFAQNYRYAKWNTPVALALTGVVTIAANFYVSWNLAKQAGSQAITVIELQSALSAALAAQEDARAISTANLNFQFEIMRSELSRFAEDDPNANLKRAEALLFLTRAGLLSGLDVQFLAQTAERAINLAGGDIDALPIPSLGATASRTFVCPENAQYPPATLQNVGPEVVYQLDNAIRNRPVRLELGSGLNQHQKASTAARQTAERKFAASLS